MAKLQGRTAKGSTFTLQDLKDELFEDWEAAVRRNMETFEGKFALYQACETLEVYILVNQFEQHVEVYRREHHWQQELFHAGQTIHLDQMDLELSVDDIYEGILA